MVVRALFVAAALLTAAVLEAATLSPPATVEALLLNRDFEALESVLRQPPTSPPDGERLFVTALTKLDAPAFYRLYEIAPDVMKSHAMTAAALHGRADLLEGLVTRGMDANAMRGAHGSVLTTAAKAGKVDVIEWALKSGVRPLPEDSELNELTAASHSLRAAQTAGQNAYQESVFWWLETRGFRPSVHPGAMHELLSQLARFGDIGLLDRYVQVFKARNAFDPNSRHRGVPLVYSALTVPVLKYLEEQGAKLDVPSVDETATAKRAIKSQAPGGRVAGIGTSMPGLLEPANRANPLENRDLDRDARFYLLSKGLPARGDALLNVVQSTPADLELIEALLKAGADPNWRPDSRCGAPLHCVAEATGTERLDIEQARKLIQLLVQFGADLQQPARFNVLPIHRALMTCNWDAVKVWLDAGYDVNVVASGRTLLGWHAMNAPYCNKPTAEIIRGLARAGANPNAGSPPPLLNLVRGTVAVPLEIIDALLDSGAEVNAADASGNTSLHHLVFAPPRFKEYCSASQQRTEPCAQESAQDRSQLIRHLVARGADPARTNKAGLSALDAAHKNPQEENRRAYVDALTAAARAP